MYEPATAPAMAARLISQAFRSIMVHSPTIAALRKCATQRVDRSHLRRVEVYGRGLDGITPLQIAIISVVIWVRSSINRTTSAVPSEVSGPKAAKPFGRIS